MGLSEQLLYLGICLTVFVKTRDNHVSMGMGTIMYMCSCHLIRLNISGHLFLYKVHLQYELTQFKWVHVNHVRNH